MGSIQTPRFSPFKSTSSCSLNCLPLQVTGLWIALARMLAAVTLSFRTWSAIRVERWEKQNIRNDNTCSTENVNFFFKKKRSVKESHFYEHSVLLFTRFEETLLQCLNLTFCPRKRFIGPVKKIEQSSKQNFQRNLHQKLLT